MIETVLGPIAPGALGATSMHEHVISDARALGLGDDVVLDDPVLAAEELRRVATAGQRAVVDPTAWGFGGPAAGLPAISRASGVQIVAGVGAYLERTRPPWLAALDVDALADRFVAALDHGLPGCGFRAGIVGVVAPGHPVSAGDERVLRAAGAAATSTGAAVIVRVDPRHRDGLALLEILAREGLAADRVVLSNVDGYVPDLVPLRELAATGATLKWCFGYEAPPRPGLTSATDAQRVEALCGLLAEGFDRQVLACGVWTRAALHACGGFGYDHLAARIVPALRERGLSSGQVDDLLVAQPRRLLTRSRSTRAAPSR